MTSVRYSLFESLLLKRFFNSLKTCIFWPVPALHFSQGFHGPAWIKSSLLYTALSKPRSLSLHHHTDQVAAEREEKLKLPLTSRPTEGTWNHFGGWAHPCLWSFLSQGRTRREEGPFLSNPEASSKGREGPVLSRTAFGRASFLRTGC